MANRNYAIFRALTGAAHNLRSIRKRLKRKIAQFTDAETTSIQEFEHGTIAQISRICTVHRIHQTLHRLLRQYLRQHQPLLGSLKSLHRICGDQAHSLEVCEKLLD